jgi:hypothetical protein
VKGEAGRREEATTGEEGKTERAGNKSTHNTNFFRQPARSLLDSIPRLSFSLLRPRHLPRTNREPVLLENAVFSLDLLRSFRLSSDDGGPCVPNPFYARVEEAPENDDAGRKKDRE